MWMSPHLKARLPRTTDANVRSLHCESLDVNIQGVIVSHSSGAAALLKAAPDALYGQSLDSLAEFHARETGQILPDFLLRLTYRKGWEKQEAVDFRLPSGHEYQIVQIAEAPANAANHDFTLWFRPSEEENTVQYSEDRRLLEATARMAQVGGWELDRDSGRVRWTAQTFHIHELEPGDSLRLEEALSFYVPEDRDILKAAIKCAVDHGRPFDLELRLVTAKGNIRYTKSLCRPVVTDGRTVKLQGTFQDITEQKNTEVALSESESRYRDIFENNSAIKLLIDPVTERIVEANTAAVDFYGYSPKEIRQLKISDINIADGQDVREKLHAAREEEVSELEFQHRLASGEIRDVKVHTGTVRINQQVLVHSIIFDITERKRAQESLLRMQQLESLGTLAGGIAHDFNNVLTVIFGNLSIVRDTMDAQHPAMRFLSNAEHAITRATGLSKQLLTFAKGGAPVCENVSLVQLITDIVCFDLTGSNVCPVFSFSQDLWDVHVDRAQLEQVFSNLTLNADHAMSNGGSIYVAARNAVLSANDIPGMDAGRYVVVTFRDEGTGIRSPDLPRIFEPYYSTKTGGSGLGLATSYSIVKKHNGHIDAVSEFGVGTTFTVLLPAAAKGNVSDEEMLDSADSISVHTRRILVLDDEKMILDVISRMLSMLGAKVDTCQQTRQAVAAYREAFENGNCYDLVILDLTIPGGPGGKEAVRHILSIDPKANVVCSSGYTDDHVMAEFRQYGFKGAIAKPYTSADLRRVVDQFPLRKTS